MQKLSSSTNRIKMFISRDNKVNALKNLLTRNKRLLGESSLPERRYKDCYIAHIKSLYLIATINLCRVTKSTKGSTTLNAHKNYKRYYGHNWEHYPAATLHLCIVSASYFAIMVKKPQILALIWTLYRKVIIDFTNVISVDYVLLR